MKNQPSTIQVVYHIFLPWQFYLVMGGCIVAAPCCLAEWVNNLSHGGFLKWANEELGVYWDFLSVVFSLGGWSHGFGAFWSAHPYLALGIFLAIPMMGIIATSLILKRVRLAASIVRLALWTEHVYPYAYSVDGSTCRSRGDMHPSLGLSSCAPYS